MTELENDIMQGLNEAIAFTKDDAEGVVVHTFPSPNVRAIREKLHLTQLQFSEVYKIPIATLKNWEQGRRNPDQTAAAYLSVIAKFPHEAKAAFAL